MYTDLLIKIKNAQQARHEFIKVPFSNMRMAIAELLAKHGYVESVAKKGRLPKRVIEINLRYDSSRQGAIQGLTFISKPSLRVYKRAGEIFPVRHGHGMGVISTPQGIMTYNEAKKAKTGGQALFEIW